MVEFLPRHINYHMIHWAHGNGVTSAQPLGEQLAVHAT